MRKKKNVFRNDSPEGATDTSVMIGGEFEIVFVEYFRVLSDFLIVFSFYSENGVSIPYAVCGHSIVFTFRFITDE